MDNIYSHLSVSDAVVAAHLLRTIRTMYNMSGFGGCENDWRMCRLISKSSYVQLERVEYECENEMMPWWILLASLVASASLFAVLWLLNNPFLLFICVFLLFASGNIINYRTDPDGLNIEGRTWYRYRWRRSIKWADVKEASLLNSGTGRILFIFRNGRRKCVTLGKIKGHFPDDNNAKMEASIYQHLRKAGAAEHLRLRQDAESYLTDIPDQIPDTTSVVRDENEFTTTYSVTSEMLEVKWIPNRDISTGSYEYLKDTIEFQKVRNCEWYPYNSSGFELTIEATDADTALKVNSDETEMQKLVLAAVRQLRKNPKTDAIWLPQVLVNLVKSYDSIV